MQLAPTDELILVSGQPPIRAKKLRYFEDEAFTARVLPAPALGDTAYPDLPPSRPDKWAGQIRGVDVRLDHRVGNDSDAEAGGLEQARHPAHEIEHTPVATPDITDPLGLAADDTDAAAERRAMDAAHAEPPALVRSSPHAAPGLPHDPHAAFLT